MNRLPFFKGVIDTTLRDGQQSPLMFDSRKYRFTLEDKKKIINGLIQLGVTHFEFFAPIVSADERAHFTKIKEYIITLTKKPIMLIAHCRCHETDINEAIKAGFNGLNLYIGVAKHSRDHSHGYSYEEILKRVPKLLKSVRKQYPNLYLRFSIEDSFRTPIKDIYEVYDTIYPYVQTVGMPDTVGVATPEMVRRRVRAIKKRYPKTDIECHFHNDRSFSIINAVTAVEAGASYIDTSIWGLAERSGITSITGLLLNLAYMEKTISQRYNLEVCYPLNALMGSILNLQVPYTEPVSLTNRTHTAGVHQKAVLNNAIVYEAHDLAHYGVQNNQILLGPLSGWNLVLYYLKEIGNFSVTVDQAKEITIIFKGRVEEINKQKSPEEVLFDIASERKLKLNPVPIEYSKRRLENLE